MKKPAFLLFLLAFATFAFSQKKIVAQIDTPAKNIFIDNLDNTYLLTQQDELLKYDQNGKLRWRYSNNRFGKLQSVDVSDPLRTVLFFGDFQQAVILNNNLNEITSYSFARNTNLQISALASSNNNGFWAYERNGNVLLKLSRNFAEDLRSANLYQLFGEMINAKKLLAGDQYIYLQRQDNKILQFDRFGGYLKPLPIDSLTDFNITRNEIAYFRDRQLYLYNATSGTNNQQVLPITATIKQVAVGNKLIVVLTEKAVFLLADK